MDGRLKEYTAKYRSADTTNIIRSKLILNSNLAKSRSPITFVSVDESFWFFCAEHGSDTAVLCAKSQDDWIIEPDFMDERGFARFEFKVGFERISYIAQQYRISAATAKATAKAI